MIFFTFRDWSWPSTTSYSLRPLAVFLHFTKEPTKSAKVTEILENHEQTEEEKGWRCHDSVPLTRRAVNGTASRCRCNFSGYTSLCQILLSQERKEKKNSKWKIKVRKIIKMPRGDKADQPPFQKITIIDTIHKANPLKTYTAVCFCLAYVQVILHLRFKKKMYRHCRHPLIRPSKEQESHFRNRLVFF